MNIVRYKTPQLSNWPSFDRFSSLRHFLDSAFELADGRSAWSPAVNVHEDPEKVTVQLELAGVQKENFDISLHDDTLTISGERKSGSESSEGGTFRAERCFGSFSRKITLPSHVKADAVKAEYQDGILTVTLPKAEEAKPRKIQVELN